MVEVALIRPGPIQGGSVHPYIRRRNGQEPVTYLHPLLENALGKTLGVPLFQEQLMQMAIDVAGFTPAESDELRQAMGSKRSATRMERLRERLYAGMAERGITGDVADEIFTKMKAFANYGFPEIALGQLRLPRLRLVVDQVPRAGGVLRRADQRPADGVLVAAHAGARRPPARRDGAHPRPQRCRWRRPRSKTVAIRCGSGWGRCAASGRSWPNRSRPSGSTNGAFTAPEDLVRRVPELTLAQLEAMATAGVFGECFGLDRRQALWAVGSPWRSRVLAGWRAWSPASGRPRCRG